jgi:endonuclease YncB( thermonuclease family)
LWLAFCIFTMSRRRSPADWKFTLLALAIVGLVGLAKWKGWLPQENRPPGSPQPAPPAEAAATVNLPGGWVELRGCTLAEDRGNDGDSFEIWHGGQRQVMRLYFVDCPEKTRHQYNGARLAEQGRYFGGLTEEETVGIGEKARDFTLDRLRAGSFRVLTRWEQVFDSERHYAFVMTGQDDLGELLVREGLARIFTKGEDRPGGRRAKAEKQHLQAVERQAKAARQGAWALRQR